MPVSVVLRLGRGSEGGLFQKLACNKHLEIWISFGLCWWDEFGALRILEYFS